MSKAGRREAKDRRPWVSTALLEERLQGMLAEQPITPLRLLLVTTALIFMADIFVMFILLLLPPLTGQAQALLDGFLLAVVIFPALYLLLFRPLLAMNRVRREAEMAAEATESYARLWDDVDNRDQPHRYVPDVYCLLDLKGSILDWNLAAERLLGYTRDELAGEGMRGLKLLAPVQMPRLAMILARSALGQSTGPTELVLRTKHGKRLPVEVATFPVRVEDRTLLLAVVQDVTARREAEQALRESRRRFRDLANMLPQSVWEMDNRGRFTFANRQMLESHGYSPEDVPGRLDVGELFSPEDRDRVERDIQRIAAGEDLGGIECRALRKDGTVFPVLVYAAPIVRDGRTVGVRGVTLDITERKRSEDMLRQSMAAAESASLAKTEFLTRMSHEIRTPVHGTMGMIDLALDTSLTSEQKEYLSIARSSAESLLGIINDVLDFSKIGARELKLERRPFDLRSTVEVAVDMVALRAQRKGLELLCRIPPDVPGRLIGDAGRLRQVLVNLVGNAVKFTTSGEVEACITVEEDRGDEVALRFSVRDTGAGIPSDRREVIFEAFRQADGSTTREHGGTGLGLTISQELVGLMGGCIRVESEPGEGSTFYFTIVFPRSFPGEENWADWVPPAGMGGARVLVVDDNATSRLIVRELLTDWGMEVSEADSGAAAVQAIEKAGEGSGAFGLILLDRTMPEMEGLTLVERLCRRASTRDSVVVMLGSDSVHDEAPHCRQLGIRAYLVKPVKQSNLLEVAMTVLGSPAADQPDTGPLPPATCGALSRRILLAEDNAAAQLLVRRRMESLGHSVCIVDNGSEVLRALEEAEFDLVVMDVEMPEMDGLEATRAIRRKEVECGGHIPIIAMTAYAMEEDRDRCLEAGMDGYVSKPVDPLHLQREIERLLAAERQAALPVNVGAALEAAGGDRELLQEAVAMFLEDDFPRLYRQLMKGIKEGDAPLVRAAAHGIKGAVTSLGGQRAGAIALRLQEMGQQGNLTGAGNLVGELEEAIARFRRFYNAESRLPEEVSRGLTE